VNVIWQGDANRLALRALTQASSPATALNVTGPMVHVRDVATMIGRAAGVSPVFADDESDRASEKALVANVQALETALPYAALPLETLCAWAVAWIRADGRLLNKPTKFEVRDGKF
jgi:nucleoside-diphosphate-sugar epimerase